MNGLLGLEKRIVVSQLTQVYIDQSINIEKEKFDLNNPVEQ